MAKKNKDDEILNELYRRSYAESTPYGNWDEILENSPMNEFGQKDIPFMDYSCPKEIMEGIFDSVMKEYRVPKNRINAFSFHFWLGCSPKNA